MKKHEAERLITVIRELAAEEFNAGVGPTKGKVENLTPPKVGALPAHLKIDPKDPLASEKALAADIAGNGRAKLDAEQLENIYRQFKQRFIDELPQDPVLIHLLASRPEIILELEPRVVNLEWSTMKGRVARLIASGWFTSARKVYTVRMELARTGSDPGGGGTLGANLNDFVRDGFLVRDGDGFVVAPGIKVTEKIMEVV